MIGRDYWAKHGFSDFLDVRRMPCACAKVGVCERVQINAVIIPEANLGSYSSSVPGLSQSHLPFDFPISASTISSSSHPKANPSIWAFLHSPWTTQTGQASLTLLSFPRVRRMASTAPTRRILSPCHPTPGGVRGGGDTGLLLSYFSLHTALLCSRFLPSGALDVLIPS